jgi:hypothetical protein
MMKFTLYFCLTVTLKNIGKLLEIKGNPSHPGIHRNYIMTQSHYIQRKLKVRWKVYIHIVKNYAVPGMLRKRTNPQETSS